MHEEIIRIQAAQLLKKGYQIDLNPMVPGVRGLLYAKSKQITTIGPIKFFNHFLFVDWENDHFGQIEQLLETRKKLSVYVNQSYKVPHGWRMKIPNLAVIALSQNGFTPEAVSCATNQYFIPWLGGEVGQIMLLDLKARELIHHYKRTYKQTGSIPLGFAVEEIRSTLSNFLIKK